jgi:hypothetical protein
MCIVYLVANGSARYYVQVPADSDLNWKEMSNIESSAVAIPLKYLEDVRLRVPNVHGPYPLAASSFDTRVAETMEDYNTPLIDLLCNLPLEQLGPGNYSVYIGINGNPLKRDLIATMFWQPSFKW